MFGFPDGEEHGVLYDNAIVCAEHRTVADQIIAELSLKKKMDLGIFGLAARVRKRIAELKGEPPQATAKKKQRSTREDIERMSGEMADIREELAAARASDPEKHWRADPEAIGRTMAVADPNAFRRLVRAGLTMVYAQQFDKHEKLREYVAADLADENEAAENEAAENAAAAAAAEEELAKMHADEDDAENDNDDDAEEPGIDEKPG
jgi:hypothetical protein